MKALYLTVSIFLTQILYAGNMNEYQNHTAGFKVTKPKAWYFVTAQENMENLKNTKFENKEFQKKMLEYATVPLVMMAKYQEPFNDLNPSFKVNVKPLAQLQGMTAKEFLNRIIPQFKQIFKDFKVVQEPIKTKVSGLEAAYMRLNYLLVTKEGGTFPTTSELWIVLRGDYFFMIGSGTRTDEKTGSRKEIQEIINSIEITL